MKSVIVAILLASVSAFAGEAPAETTVATSPKVSCVVPVENGSSVVSLEVSKSPDTSVDFVTVTLTGPNMNETLFTQLEPGTYDKQLAAGQLGTLILKEGFGMEHGVLKNAGFIVLNTEADGSMSGMMAASGNIYPLSCKVTK